MNAIHKIYISTGWHQKSAHFILILQPLKI